MFARRKPKAEISDAAGKPAVLTIDMAAIRENYRRLRTRTGATAQVAAVIKANAYGLGVEKILPVFERENCPFYFVATPDEGIQVRKLTRKPLAVLGGLFGAPEEFVRHDLIPVISAPQDMALWRQAAQKYKKRLPVILQVETGMNRLGLLPEDIRELRADPALTSDLDIFYIMSHFACADEKDHPLTTQQFERFKVLAGSFPGVKRSLANSAGIFRSPAYHMDMVRPGMSLYGLNPTPETDNPMMPVISLHARITQVKPVKKGEFIGYGASHRFGHDTIVASVAFGYADGFLRSLGNKGILYYEGKPCPVIGRVSMDCVTVDMGKARPAPGDMIEVIGPGQSATALASAAGTIDYEILTSLGARYHRIYKDG